MLRLMGTTTEGRTEPGQQRYPMHRQTEAHMDARTARGQLRAALVVYLTLLVMVLITLVVMLHGKPVPKKRLTMASLTFENLKLGPLPQPGVRPYIFKIRLREVPQPVLYGGSRQRVFCLSTLTTERLPSGWQLREHHHRLLSCDRTLPD